MWEARSDLSPNRKAKHNHIRTLTYLYRHNTATTHTHNTSTAVNNIASVESHVAPIYCYIYGFCGIVTASRIMMILSRQRSYVSRSFDAITTPQWLHICWNPAGEWLGRRLLLPARRVEPLMNWARILSNTVATTKRKIHERQQTAGTMPPRSWALWARVYTGARMVV